VTDEIPNDIDENSSTKDDENINQVDNVVCESNDNAQQQQYIVEITPPETISTKKKKNIIKPIIAIVLLIIVICASLIIIGKPVKEVKMSEDTVTIETEQEYTIICTILPDDAKNKTLKFKSSNDDVATVNEEGIVVGVAEGECTITATSISRKSGECTVKVVKPSFKNRYSDISLQSWCEISSDGSCMSIDTNPNDYDKKLYFLYSDVFNAANSKIKEINTDLGFTDAVYEKMCKTTALQGRQTEENDKYRVSWTYHPDKGLEVMYEIKF
jgi:uncharacterized protein YjdB